MHKEVKAIAEKQIKLVLTKNEAAEIMSVSPACIDAWRRSGKLKAIKAGHRWIYPVI